MNHIIKVFTLILILSFSSLLFAKSFIQSIDLTKNSISFMELKKKVSTHRLHKKNYLSLGESHLHPSTSRPVLLDLAKQFLTDTKWHKKFCTENIASFLNTRPGLEIKRLSHKISIHKGNSPYRTDFKQCYERDSELILTYSGFFHQHPFANLFQSEFLSTPVITDPTNNIRAQMPNARGLFVTLMELDHLEMTTSNYILKKKISNIQEFRAEVNLSTYKIKSLRKKMSIILNNDTAWRTKSGMILEQAHFKNSNVLPTNTYIILTDINSRLTTQPLKLLNELANLSDQLLEKYLNFILEERSYYTTSFFEPAADGTLSDTGYGTYGQRFPGGSSFLDLIHSNKKSILIVSSPLAKRLKCFTKSNDVILELDCEDIF